MTYIGQHVDIGTISASASAPKFHQIIDSRTFSKRLAGFGNRFGKPKGPRSYPETWV
uniref:Uncharacterized protein n=1 Tax=Mola mola TaxID=94237 RepID=A0A3Q3WVW1_MOLML